MKKKFYIIPVFGCTDPEPMIGPFKSYDAMLKRARKVHDKQREEDALFWMVTYPNRRPGLGSFALGELDPDLGSFSPGDLD